MVRECGNFLRNKQKMFFYRHKGFLKDCPNGLLTEKVRKKERKMVMCDECIWEGA
jgi:hypothetical protein